MWTCCVGFGEAKKKNPRPEFGWVGSDQGGIGSRPSTQTAGPDRTKRNEANGGCCGGGGGGEVGRGRDGMGYMWFPACG